MKIHFKFYKPIVREIIRHQEVLREKDITELKITINKNFVKLIVINSNNEEKELSKYEEYAYLLPVMKAANKLSEYVYKGDTILIESSIQEDIFEFEITILDGMGMCKPKKIIFIKVQSYTNFLKQRKFKILSEEESERIEFFPFALYDDRPYI